MPVGTVRPPLYLARIPTTDPPAVDVVRWRTPAGSACRTWSRNTGVPARISRPYLPLRVRATPTRPLVPAVMASHHARVAVALCRTLPGPQAPRPSHRVRSHPNTVFSHRALDGRGPITTRHQLGRSSARSRSRSPPSTTRRGSRTPRPTHGARSACHDPAVPLHVARGGQRRPVRPTRPPARSGFPARPGPPSRRCRRSPPRRAGRKRQDAASHGPASPRPTACHRRRQPPPAVAARVAPGTGSQNPSHRSTRR